MRKLFISAYQWFYITVVLLYTLTNYILYTFFDSLKKINFSYLFNVLLIILLSTYINTF